jgi:hypothetical protein
MIRDPAGFEQPRNGSVAHSRDEEPRNHSTIASMLATS